LIWGSLWLTRSLQARLGGVPGGGGRNLQLVETSLIAPGVKLAVVRFHEREILLGLSRHGMVRLGEATLREAPAAEPESE
jgi:flagellar protein FliO/FliZ